LSWIPRSSRGCWEDTGSDEDLSLLGETEYFWMTELMNIT